ncbi:MAG: hypothetical protein AAF557_21700 [Pseudomonadota bacterium]
MMTIRLAGTPGRAFCRSFFQAPKGCPDDLSGQIRDLAASLESLEAFAAIAGVDLDHDNPAKGAISG